MQKFLNPVLKFYQRGIRSNSYLCIALMGKFHKIPNNLAHIMQNHSTFQKIYFLDRMRNCVLYYLNITKRWGNFHDSANNAKTNLVIASQSMTYNSYY